MSIEETKSNDYKLIFGGIFLGVTSLIIIVCLFIFMSNCDNDYCTISDSVQDEIIKARTAIGISGGLLFLFGVLHVSARTEKMKKIVKSNTFSGAWANALFPVLSLTLLVSSIYLYTIVNEKNFVCSDDTGTTKSKRNSRYTSITTPINIMIGMSVLLLISSIIVLYNFWKKTDEEKLADAEKAKASLSKIDDKIISEGPVSLYKKLDEIETSLSQAKGLYEDELDNAQIENLIESVKLKKSALNDAVSRKKSDLETEKEKMRDVLSSQTKRTKQQQDIEFAMHDFNAKSDKDKFEYLCKIKSDNPDLLKKLQATPFYKENSKKIEEVCSISGGKIDLIEKRDNLIAEWHSLPDDNTLRINFLDKLCSKENQKDNIGKLVLDKLKTDDQITLARTGVRVTDYIQTCSVKGIEGTIENLVTRQKERENIRGPGPVTALSSGPPRDVLGQRTNVIYDQVVSLRSNIDDKAASLRPHPEREKQIEEGVEETRHCDEIINGLSSKGTPDEKTLSMCRQLGDEKNTGVSDRQLFQCFKNREKTGLNSLDELQRQCRDLTVRTKRLENLDKQPIEQPANMFKPKLTKRIIKKRLN